jgi:hypothetical protein
MLQKSILLGSLIRNFENKLSFIAAKYSTESKTWKDGVVIQPLATSPEDLKRNNKLYKDGFYVNHRLFIKELPKEYTIKPFKTLRTGGRDFETSKRTFKMSLKTLFYLIFVFNR